jgi:amidase
MKFKYMFLENLMPAISLSPFASASECLNALQKREISSVELLELYLNRIERYNPDINAIVIPDYENARKTAAEADAARSRGEEKPLLGLPITIKDCLDVKGLRGTAGVPDFAERRPEQDARIVARAREAGAVLIGKTNVPPNAGDWQSNNPIFGRTRNPWNLDRSPGGSTGGGAAALAAGLATLEFGSDIGGSIRIPAAFCGVYGHRPSDSAIPHSGHFPGSPLPNSAFSLGVFGPLARSPKDLELALDVIAGPDAGEDVAWRLEFPAARHERLDSFRVAVMPPLGWLVVEDEIQSSVERVADHLRQQGATVEVARPDALGDYRDYYALYASLLAVLMNLGLSPEDRQKSAEELANQDDPFSISYRRGLTGNAADYVIWHSQREAYRAAFREFFKQWDVLIAPITLVPPFPHDDSPLMQRTLTVNGQKVSYLQQLVYPSLATLVGHPATAITVGLNREGLPLGLQVIGPYLEDRTPLRFAQLLEQTFGGFQPPPGYEA